MCSLYFFVFSYTTVAKFYSLKTAAYDLGNYNQALYNTLIGHGLLYYTPDLPANPSGSMMGVHFSPILFIILPIYAIYPAPPTLLVLQTFVLVLGVFPLYWLGKHLFETKLWGLFFSAVYLLNPVLQGINWFDFHPEAFFATFFLFSIYYGFKGEWSKYLISSAFALTTIEYAAILIAFNSIYLLWIYRKELKVSLEACRHLNFRCADAKVKYPLLMALTAVIWLILALQVISFFSPRNPMVEGGAPQWSILGAKGIFEVPIRVILSPEEALAALTYDLPLKLLYLTIIFGSTAFLSLLDAKMLISTLPWLGIALLSNYQPFYYIGTQYPAFLLPQIMASSVIGIKKIASFSHEKSLLSITPKKIASCLLIVSMFFSILTSPLYGFHIGSWPALEHLNAYGLPFITEHDSTVMKIISLIPENASVITQQNIFPLLSSRKNSFVIPLGSFYPPNTDFNTTFDQWLRNSDYALIDLKTSPLEAYLVYTRIKAFKVYAFADGVALLKQNYFGDPVLFEPYEGTFNWKNLTLINGISIIDYASDSQQVFMHENESSIAEDFWGGPHVFLSPGIYSVTFRLKATSTSDSSIVTIGVYGSPLELDYIIIGTKETGYNLMFSTKISNVSINYNSKTLSSENFTANLYKEFTIMFYVDIPAVFEFKGTVTTSNVDVYLDWIKIVQLKALP